MFLDYMFSIYKRAGVDRPPDLLLPMSLVHWAQLGAGHMTQGPVVWSFAVVK